MKMKMNEKSLMEAMSYIKPDYLKEAEEIHMKELDHKSSHKSWGKSTWMKAGAVAAAVVVLGTGTFALGKGIKTGDTEPVTVVQETTEDEQQAHLSKNYDNQNTVADEQKFFLEDGIVQKSFGSGDGNNRVVGEVGLSSLTKSAMSVYAGTDVKYVVQLDVSNGVMDESGETTFSATEMEQIYNTLKATGMNVVYVPAGHYIQNDGEDRFYSRNKIYATVTAEEIANFPVFEKYSIALCLANYADFSYVDGNYKELHQAWWDANEAKREAGGYTIEVPAAE